MEDRAAAIRDEVGHLPNVEVVTDTGLTTALAAKVGAEALIRGAARDHRTELAMAAANESSAGIPTLFIPADADSHHVSSTALRIAAGRD